MTKKGIRTTEGTTNRDHRWKKEKERKENPYRKSRLLIGVKGERTGKKRTSKHIPDNGKWGNTQGHTHTGTIVYIHTGNKIHRRRKLGEERKKMEYSHDSGWREG